VFNAIRNNRSLRSLIINYNELDDEKLMYGAFELTFNKNLTYCSIEGNKVPSWKYEINLFNIIVVIGSMHRFNLVL
jgi:hypothetical protein